MDQSSFIEARKIMSSIWASQAFTNQKVCKIADIYGLDHLNEDFNVIMVSLMDRDYDVVEAERELNDLRENLTSHLLTSTTLSGEK